MVSLSISPWIRSCQLPASIRGIGSLSQLVTGWPLPAKLLSSREPVKRRFDPDGAASVERNSWTPRNGESDCQQAQHAERRLPAEMVCTVWPRPAQDEVR